MKTYVVVARFQGGALAVFGDENHQPYTTREAAERRCGALGRVLNAALTDLMVQEVYPE